MLEQKTRKTLDVLKALNGLEFAITGSYAQKILNGGSSRSHFDDNSDIDIAVFEPDLEEAYERLKTSENFLGGYEFFGYDGDGPKPIPMPKPPRPYSKHKGYKLEVSEGLPVHLISTLKSAERDEFVNIGGLNYLFPDYSRWN